MLQRTLDTPINELPISVRVHNCLINLGIVTVRDLLQKTEADLRRCPNFGGVSLRELKSVLDSMGLELARVPSPIRPTWVAGLPTYIVLEIERATDQFHKRRVEIETRKWTQKQNKKLRARKKTASEQSIATAEGRARYRERDRIIVLLRDAGQTFVWIGKVLSVSGNRISQIYCTIKWRQKREAERQAARAKVRADASSEADDGHPLTGTDDGPRNV
jgi:hypothetical protein